MQWVEWTVGVLFLGAAVSLVYAGILYYGFERVHRPSPSRVSTWIWMGLAAGLGMIAVAILLATGRIR